MRCFETVAICSGFYLKYFTLFVCVNEYNFLSLLLVTLKHIRSVGLIKTKF